MTRHLTSVACCGLTWILLTATGCNRTPGNSDPELVHVYNILVLDFGSGAASFLFAVNPVDGFRTVFSDFSDPKLGPTTGRGRDVKVEASGHILVQSTGPLYRIDPHTKHRTILSDFKNPLQSATPATPLGISPVGVAVETSRNILVIDQDAGTDGNGALFRVHPDLGIRELLSDFGNPAQGPLGKDPSDVAVEASGTILVADLNAGTHFEGALFRVDPTTGKRTALTFVSTDGLICEPYRVLVRPDGSLLIGTFAQGVFQADLTSKTITYVGAGGVEERALRLNDMALEPSGNLLMVSMDYCELPCPPRRLGGVFRGDILQRPIRLGLVSDFNKLQPSDNRGYAPVAVTILRR